MNYYRDPYYDDRNAGCFGMLGILVVIGILAIYFGAYILLFFLGLGLAVGLVFSLIIYVRAFINAVKQLSASSPPGPKSLRSVIKATFALFYSVTVNSVNETMTVVSNSFTKFLNYRVLSFQKWMWLAVVITVVVSEVIFVVGVIMLEALVVFAALYIAAILIFAVLMLDLAVATVYDAVLTVSDLLKNASTYQRMDHFEFSSASTYSALMESWSKLIAGKKEYVRCTYADMFTRTKLMWAMSKAHKLLSVQKWFYIATSLVMCIVSHIINMVFMLLYTLTFIIIWIANAVFTTGAVLYRKVRP